MFRHLDKYTFKMKIIKHRYSDVLTVTKVTESKLYYPFSYDEIQALWNIEDEPWVDMVLVMMYSGWRMSEITGLKRSDVDINTGVMVSGVKTDAGKERVVPIHPKIAGIVEKRFSEGNEYLFSRNGGQLAPSTFYGYWASVMKMINANHTSHDCRYTLRTKLFNAQVQRAIIDKIIGHVPDNTGERIYTYISIEQLKEAMDLVDY